MLWLRRNEEHTWSAATAGLVIAYIQQSTTIYQRWTFQFKLSNYTYIFFLINALLFNISMLWVYVYSITLYAPWLLFWYIFCMYLIYLLFCILYLVIDCMLDDYVNLRYVHLQWVWTYVACVLWGIEIHNV